jgi:exodeoxyribonuclease V gamma subunit
MALHIHHGPRLADLADVLGRQLHELADAGVDPFEPVVVGVPTAGVRDWLTRHLAHRLGVVANVRMVFPATFVAMCTGDEPPEHDPWAVPRLTWAVFQALHDTAGGDVIDVPGPRTLHVARRIADLFDTYANNRPSVIQQWAAGIDGNGLADGRLDGAHSWQPALWREVRALIGSPSPAELRADRLTELVAGPAAGGRMPALPTQAALFGISTISPAQLDVLAAAGSHRELHVFAAHPSPAAWARSGRRLGGRLTLRAADTAPQPVHPLLRSWAAPSMELTALVSGTAAQLQPVAPAAPLPGTALGALQAAIIHDRAPEPPDQAEPQAVADDGSLQVHLCHGTLRQVEVLRDSLCALFAADHTLQPHQVLVVSPQLARFAPLAASVFQRSVPPVPVRVSDLALGSENPVAAATVHLLALLGSRCTVGQVLEVCALPAVARRMGFSSDDIATYQRWAGDLNIRWGLDADHRHEWLHLDIDEGTWESALDRLLLGAAMPAPTVRRAAHDIVPYDDVDAAAFQSAGRLAELVQHLRHARRCASAATPVTMTVTMPMAEWCRLTAELVSAVCAADIDAPWQEADVLVALEGLAADAAPLGDRATGNGTAQLGIDLAEAAAAIAEAIATTSGRLSLRSGAVTLTSMVPLRNVPARVVCILGLDDSVAGARGAGDDILALQPCVGERDPSSEGRALLLDALLAAQEHCIITCDGIDITTNRPIALPVALGELLDVAGGADLAVRHPRHGWDARNVRAEAPFSFDPVMVEAARAVRETHTTAGAAARTTARAEFAELLPVVLPPRVTVAELAEACTRPARTYLRHGVDVRLPAGIDDSDDNVALSADALQRSQLGRSLMEHHKRWRDAEQAEAQWRDAASLTGELPPRQLALAVVDVVSAEVGELIAARPAVAEAFAVTDPIPVDVAIAVPSWAQPAGLAAPATVVLTHDVHQVAGDCVVRVEFSRPKHRQLVSAAIELAALCVAYPKQSWSATVVRRPDRRDGSPDVVDLTVRDAQQRTAGAQRLLEVALDLRLRAAREPIPLFEASSQLIAVDGTLSDETVFEGAGYGPGDLSDDQVSFVWSAVSAEEMLAIPYRTRVDEPIPPRQLPGFSGHSRAASFARYLWDAVYDFVDIGVR